MGSGLVRRRCTATLALTVALTLPGVPGPAGVSSVAAGDIQVLGEAGQAIYAARHGELWSVFVDNVELVQVFDLLEGAGGPKLVYAAKPERPIRMAVHHMSLERILARMLGGYSYSLHYEDERLARVKLLTPKQGYVYKMPRAIETRAKWRDYEMGWDRGAETADEPTPPASGDAAAPAAAR